MRPPMEQGAVADGVELLSEGDTAVADRLVEALDGFEAAIGQRLVDKGPEMFGRLQFGAVRWLEDEADAVGQVHVLRAVPAGLVELKDDALAGPGPDRLGKIGKDEFEQFLAHGVGDVPHRAAGRGLDEPCHIEPLETMMAKRDRPLADRRPDPARDRLQTDAVFIGRPDLDCRAWMLAPFLGRRALEFFLSAARSCSVAAAGCRGRGCWIE